MKFEIGWARPEGEGGGRGPSASILELLIHSIKPTTYHDFLSWLQGPMMLVFGWIAEVNENFFFAKVYYLGYRCLLLTLKKKKKQIDIGIFIFDTYKNACIPRYTYILLTRILTWNLYFFCCCKNNTYLIKIATLLNWRKTNGLNIIGIIK